MLLVSVIIPTYNREALLRLAVESVLGQTYDDLEVIVVDDGSEDRTGEVITSLMEEDGRLHYLRLDQKCGPLVARNVGIRAARGEVIGFLDSDDEYLPRMLERNLEMLIRAEEAVGVVHCDCYVRDEARDQVRRFGVPKLRGEVYEDLLRRPGPMFQGMLVRREVLERIGYLDEDVLPGFDEWDTAIRLARICEFAFVDEPLFIYHRHDGDTLSRDCLTSARSYIGIVEKHLEEIGKAWGPEVIADHYEVAADWAYQGGDLGLTRNLLRKALASSKRPKTALKLALLGLGGRGFESLAGVYRRVRFGSPSGR